MTLKDSFQTVQRQMIAILAHDHLRQQTWPRQSLLNGLGRLVGNDHMGRAALAYVLGPYVLDHEQRGRDIIKLLTDFFTESLSSLSTVRTTQFLGRHRMLNPATWQIFGKWSATSVLVAMPLWFLLLSSLVSVGLALQFEQFGRE
jgi:hypothetical protein